MIFHFIIIFFLTFFLSTLILRYWGNYTNLGFDEKTKIQKVHNGKVLRIGGFIIFSIFVFYNFVIDIKIHNKVFIIIALAPIFIVGFLEDLKSNVSANSRLFFSFLSSVFLVFVSGKALGNVDVNWINNILSVKIIAIILTSIGITVTCNAWNFIDGLNGLALGTAIISLTALSILANFAGMAEMSNFINLLSACCLGFLMINMLGMIFLGDAGAYLLGTLIAWIGVYVTSDNSPVSSWSIFLIIIYPAIEITFTFFRRVINLNSPFKPDNLHLHSLLFKYLSTKLYTENVNIVNSISSILLLFYNSIAAICAIVFWNNLNMILISLFIFIFSYLILYFSLFLKLNKI